MIVERISLDHESYHDARALRGEVLRKPLGLSADDPAFSDNATDIHFVARERSTVVGIVVLVPHYQPSIGKLRQMATSESVRGKGYGRELVKSLEDYASKIGLKKIVLHSRHYAVGFYEKMGYVVTSEVFQEVGMDHYKMEKELHISK